MTKSCETSRKQVAQDTSPFLFCFAFSLIPLPALSPYRYVGLSSTHLLLFIHTFSFSFTLAFILLKIFSYNRSFIFPFDFSCHLYPSLSTFLSLQPISPKSLPIFPLFISYLPILVIRHLQSPAAFCNFQLEPPHFPTFLRLLDEPSGSLLTSYLPLFEPSYYTNWSLQQLAQEPHPALEPCSSLDTASSNLISLLRDLHVATATSAWICGRISYSCHLATYHVINTLSYTFSLNSGYLGFTIHSTSYCSLTSIPTHSLLIYFPDPSFLSRSMPRQAYAA
jgi:hypothetical protein